MSLSRDWRSDLESCKTITDAKKSINSSLFEQIDLTRFLDDEYIEKLNQRNELFQSKNLFKLKSLKSISYNDNTNINNHIASEEEISSFWQYSSNLNTNNNEHDDDNNHDITNKIDNINDISSLSHFLISQTSILCEGDIEESINFKRQLLLQRIIVMCIM